MAKPKEYPFDLIHVWGNDYHCFYSKGHHDKTLFLEAVKKELSYEKNETCDIEEKKVYHGYARFYYDFEDKGVLLDTNQNSKPKQGKFKITYYESY